MAPSKWVSIAFITLEMKTKRALAKGSSFTCGNTKMVHGRLRGSSATIITLPPNDQHCVGLFVDSVKRRVVEKSWASAKRSSRRHLQPSLEHIIRITGSHVAAPFGPSLSIRTIIKGCEDGYICALAWGI